MSRQKPFPGYWIQIIRFFFFHKSLPRSLLYLLHYISFFSDPIPHVWEMISCIEKTLMVLLTGTKPVCIAFMFTLFLIILSQTLSVTAWFGPIISGPCSCCMNAPSLCLYMFSHILQPVIQHYTLYNYCVFQVRYEYNTILSSTLLEAFSISVVIPELPAVLFYIASFTLQLSVSERRLFPGASRCRLSLSQSDPYFNNWLECSL